MTVYVDKALVKQAKRFAQDNDYATLSALIRELLMRELGLKNK